MRTRLIGTVASSRASKTLRVEVNRTYQHPVVGKYVKGRTVCHVHDENEEAGEGDTVEIEESRPLSKLKRWRLIRVIEKSKEAEALRILHEHQAARKRVTAEDEAAVIVDATAPTPVSNEPAGDGDAADEAEETAEA